MVPRINLAEWRAKQTPEDMANNRQKTLDACKQFKEAQEALEKTCAELGIEVPVLVCAA
ncbi:hypothetical protein D3C81_1860630 [compost metagenome]